MTELNNSSHIQFVNSDRGNGLSGWKLEPVKIDIWTQPIEHQMRALLRSPQTPEAQTYIDAVLNKQITVFSHNGNH